MSNIKLFIIDDSAVVRTTIATLIESERSIELMGSANDPIIAMEKFNKSGWPDVILLDIEMPRMDGLTFLRKIMSERPTPVIICSSLVKKGSRNAVEALSLGALEIIAKPEVGVRDFLEDSKDMLISAVKAAALAKNKIKTTISIATIAPEDLVNFSADTVVAKKNAIAPVTHNIIAIGSSTGGPQTLEGIIKALPANVPPIVIVQHMPAGFTKSLAERLDKICAVAVKEAENGDRLLQGRILLAPGDKHMLIKRVGGSYTVEIKEGPKVSRHRPSVDVLFRSCANEAGSNATGIILTGMGDDGARGMKEMFDTKAKTYAQDEKSCIVYGMPKEAVALGGVTKSVTLSEIVGIIKRG